MLIILFHAAIVIEVTLVIFSFITFQLNSENLRNPKVLRKTKWVVTAIFVPLVLLCVIINIAPAILVMYSWVNATVTVFNVTYIFNVPKSPSNTIPELLTSSFNVHSLNDSAIVDNLNGFEAFFKLVVAFFSFSSALSFILFIYALVCTYKCAGLRRF